MNRRSFFLQTLGWAFLASGCSRPQAIVNSSTGPIKINDLGRCLIHEHALVDFIGADQISFDRWNPDAVVAKVKPYLLDAVAHGVKTFFDCTPAFLGRDVLLLRRLAEETGLQIITTTGYYGAVQNKFLPRWAFEESAEQLAARWVAEWRDGIDGTGIKPGFIKIGVDANEKLSPLHAKLVEAAAYTHLQTGLTICSHTGPGHTAFEELAIVKALGVGPSAFVWVHAQAATDFSFYERAAREGMWISLDGMGWGDTDNYVNKLVALKSGGHLGRVLISHDAGWYKPEDPAAPLQGYVAIFEEVMPRLAMEGFTESDFYQLLEANPAEAFAMRVRKI